MKVLRPNFEKEGGLVVAIVQDCESRQILMQGFANEEAFRLTLETGFATFWSRSRKKLWKKGEESGNVLRLVGSVLIDCDGDSVIYFVDPVGPACHTNQQTCFYRSVVDVDKAEFPSPKDALQVTELEVNDGLIIKEGV